MQTFLPFPDYEKSAFVLDRLRLGKQRVEVLQLLKAIHEGGSWSNHPAARMWRGYENALCLYGVTMCSEWIKRGYKDTCAEKISAYFNPGLSCEEPPWFGDESFHQSHRSNLLRKDFNHYSEYFNEPIDSPYIWPV